MTLAVATSASTNQLTSTTIAAAAPASIADGDILIAFVAKNTTTAPSGAPSGWVRPAPSPFIASSGSQSQLGANLTNGWYGVYWKVASGESGTYTWTSSSSNWNVQILRLTGFRAPKPGGAVVETILFADALIHARSTNTITLVANNHSAPAAWADGMLLIRQFVQTVTGVTATFSALSGTMTQVANSNQTGVSQLVAYEYLDMTANPNFGNRQITTDQASGGTGGASLLLPDPSSLTSPPVDKRNDLSAQAA